MSQLRIQPIRITPRFCKLQSSIVPFLFFFFSFLFFVPYVNRNHKDTTHPQGTRLDATFYIDQNVIQVCQPEFLMIWRVWIFLFKKLGDFSLNRNILKIAKKIGLQAIYLLFDSVSSSIEVFWSASFSSTQQKYVIWWRFVENSIFGKNIISVLKKV